MSVQALRAKDNVLFRKYTFWSIIINHRRPVGALHQQICRILKFDKCLFFATHFIKKDIFFA